jgi:histidyl-tRNA synthetase
MRFQAARGTQDVLPGQSGQWVRLESIFRDLVRRYGYQEIRTPTFEETDLFVRTSGETSDIVSKQMYSFVDKGGRNMTLKPEGTAPAIRAMLEHNLLAQGGVCRLAYETAIYRYERPQKGRLREAHQFGLELVGSTSSWADAEIIEVTVRFYEAIGIPKVVVLLNSIGREECRSRFRDQVLAHLASYLADQPAEDRARAERNPLRMLDSKDPKVQQALSDLPPITDCLEDDSRARFEKLKELLARAGVPFRESPEVVRGLDYYTETVFEVHSPLLGAQSALCGGGRYDNLIQEIGGPPTPSVGVGMGIERALIVLEQLKLDHSADEPETLVIVTGGEAVMAEAMDLARELRAEGQIVLVEFESKSMKAQLRAADRLGAARALIIGEDELAKGVVQVRDLKASSQIEVSRVGLGDWLRSQA